MVDSIAIVSVLGGLVLLFAGAALSVYGVAALGALLGGGGGYLLAPTVGSVIGLDGLLAAVAATGIGIVAGVVAAYLLLSLAVAAVGFLVGTYVGFVVLSSVFAGWPGQVVAPVALGVGVVAGFLGTTLTKTVMILVTSFVGAALTSRSVTVGDFEAAQSALTLDPLLFDLWSPLFLVLLVLGVLAQFGLFRFGYVTRLVALLPGASTFRDRGSEARPGTGADGPGE